MTDLPSEPRALLQPRAALDAARVEAFVRERFGPGAGNVLAFDQGEWSKAFAYTIDGEDRVIRFSALDEDFAKDRFAGRWRSPALPIPRVLELAPAPTDLGGYVAVSERLYGGFIDDLDEAGMRALLPSLFAVLDAARTADLGGTSGYGVWGADGHASHTSWPAFLLDVNNDDQTNRIAGWRAALEASAVGAAPFDEAYKQLQALAPLCSDDRHLIHSDLLHFNVLVADHRITGLLDWGCALYGDFLYDVAWFTFWAPWFPEWRGIDFRQEAAHHFESIGVAVPDFAERLRAYELHIGLGGMTYQAYKGFRSDLAWTARQTLELARRPL
jgi:hygromycin-B 4-O-kinase